MTQVGPMIAELVRNVDRYLSAFDHAGVREVRAGITRWSNQDPQSVTPRLIPACDHIEPALAAMSDRRLADVIRGSVPLLEWITYDSYPRAEIGEAFSEGHAFALIIGEGAFFPAEDFNLGLFVIGPNILYRDHHHAAPELYAPLTGAHGWRFLPEKNFVLMESDVPVWNEPWAPHATRTGNVPFLCIFGWTRDVMIPAKVIFANNCPLVEYPDL